MRRWFRPFRTRNPVWVGLISIAVLSAAMAFAFSLNRFPFFTGRYVIGADFADAAGLTPENEVRVAGLKVGKVKSVELNGDRVRVAMEIENGVRLGGGSTAEITLKTLLGSKFVAITPRGGRPFLEPEDVIPLERTTVPFEIYEATNQSVSRLGRLDAQALNDALRELAAITDDPEGNFARALDGLSKTTAALSERDEELASLLANGAKAAEVLAGRSEELGRIIDSGARILTELSARRDQLRRFVRGTDRVATQLSSLVTSTRADLDPALRDLHAVLEVAGGRLTELDDILKTLPAGSESFGRVFTHGEWGDIFLVSVLLESPGQASGSGLWALP